MSQSNLFDLKPGDRFYFIGDPKKEVREIKEVVMHKRGMRVQYVIYPDLKEGHQNRPLVFLRNVND